MNDRTRRLLAVTGWVLAMGLVAWTYALHPGINGNPGLTHEVYIENSYEADLVIITTMAALLCWARPRNAVGWLLGLSGVMGVLCNWGQTYGAHALVVPGSDLPLGAVVLSLSAPLWLLNIGIPATLLLARYPSGAIHGRWARRLDRLVIVAMVLLVTGYATSPEAVTDVVTNTEPPLRVPGGKALLIGSALLLLVSMLVTAAMTVRRMLRAAWPERQQLALLLAFAPMAVLGVVFSPYEWVGSLFFSGMPLAIVVGVLRYRLLGIEVVVRRTLVYGALTGLVLLVFVAVTSGVTRLGSDGTGPQLLAATVVAVGVVPARNRLQRGVDRLVYGDRRDPWRALDRLGQEAVGEDGLHDVVRALTGSLRLPGAELLTPTGTVVAVGVLGEPFLALPLSVAGAPVGELRVSARTGERSLGPEDERLLRTVAPLLALLVQSTELAAAVRREQELVVQATESERARLRRDLHDGLGPSLTGIGLGLEAVDGPTLPDRSAAIVQRLRAEVKDCLSEVRRIIDDLRPGALEASDLLGLLRTKAGHLSTTTPVKVEVVAPEELPPLSAAVEAAALRIVDEALTNVLRHARATHCSVQVRVEDGLVLRILDNGVGFAGPRQGGIGLSSMRSRAAALGGRLEVEGSESGTAVTAALPLAVPV